MLTILTSIDINGAIHPPTREAADPAPIPAVLSTRGHVYDIIKTPNLNYIHVYLYVSTNVAMELLL